MTDNDKHKLSDEELEAYLEGRHEVSGAYQALEKTGSPEALDAKILARAKEGAAETKRSRGDIDHYYRPYAVAATVFLCVTIALMLVRNPPPGSGDALDESRVVQPQTAPTVAEQAPAASEAPAAAERQADLQAAGEAAEPQPAFAPAADVGNVANREAPARESTAGQLQAERSALQDQAAAAPATADADSQGLAVERRSMVDSRNAGAIILDNVRVPAANLLGAEGAAWPGLSRALDIANIGLAAELLGLSAEAFERTVAYLKERKQFGRVIGSFQGLQHRAAELFAELELARSIVLQALHTIDDGEADLAQVASAAKAKLCEVAQRASNEAIQMHGGIGMTDEHEIGFFIKRARVAQHTFGDYNYHLDRFAQLNGF